jgi:hypothetical protein
MKQLIIIIISIISINATAAKIYCSGTNIEIDTSNGNFRAPEYGVSTTVRCSIKGDYISANSQKVIYTVRSGKIFMTVLPDAKPGWSGNINAHITISNGESITTKVTECNIK